MVCLKLNNIKIRHFEYKMRQGLFSVEVCQMHQKHMKRLTTNAMVGLEKWKPLCSVGSKVKLRLTCRRQNGSYSKQ